jgi:F-type H+-transporting ATPase subunit delta
MRESLAGTYASSLFSLAKEEGKVSQYREALSDILALFNKEPSLYQTLQSYAVERQDLYGLIDRLWSPVGLKSLCPFLKTLVANHRLDAFEDIARAYAVMANESEGIKEGLAYSAAPLTAGQLAQIESSLGKSLGAQIHLTNRVEPSLLGGVKVAVDGKVYDGSLAQRLEDLKKTLLSKGDNVR